MLKRKYGLLKDTPDPRDHLFHAGKFLAKPPPVVDLRAQFSPVCDQGDLGSCTSFSAVHGAFEFLEMKELREHTPLNQAPEEFGKNFEKGSALFHYFNERMMMGTITEDSGASIRDSVKSLAKYGVCKENRWPYNVAVFTKKPNHGAYTEGALHKVTQYARVIGLSGIKAALAAGFPVLIGIDVFESFESDEVAQTGIVPMPAEGEQLLGGHAVCVGGYDDHKGVLHVRNSWGDSWGDNGWFYLPYEYLEQHASDFWVVKK